MNLARDWPWFKNCSANRHSNENRISEASGMSEANSETWIRHSDGWVVMQEKSRRLKDEAERLNLHGEERRQFLAERRSHSSHKPKQP